MKTELKDFLQSFAAEGKVSTRSLLVNMVLTTNLHFLKVQPEMRLDVR
jgi:hypothetical protein